jgi:hypothetical protein
VHPIDICACLESAPYCLDTADLKPALSAGCLLDVVLNRQVKAMTAGDVELVTRRQPVL